VPSLELVPRIAAGEIAAVARLISRAEAGFSEARSAQAKIYSMAGRAHVVGVTGVPGSGKSTLVASLARRLRAGGERVAIIAVDPSSPYSGGAILGDRIRMSELGGDPGVFIRSMATRGATGGLARAALDAVDIVDVAGFGTVVIETVGVGQDEVEIARASTTTVVVSAPGLGDDVQAIKAGMLEIADIHVVSKCDRSDANRTITDLKQMMALGHRDGDVPDWRVPVIGVSALNDEGIDALATAIAEHRKAVAGAAGNPRRSSIAEFRLRKTAEDLLLDRLRTEGSSLSASLSARLSARDGDPYSTAETLVRQIFAQEPK
jgi:LAO/AO transport system kinase